jgi:thiol-disulfide isomerase/thioredoxin
MKALWYWTLLLWVAAASHAMAKTPGEVEVGGKLRDVPMQGLGGPSTLLSEFHGKPLIINVWASWCGPCREEMASLDRLASRYAGTQFEVIGISTDDYPAAAQAFLNRSRIKFRQFIDSRLVLEYMLGADRIPLTLLIDAQGTVLMKVRGVREWDGAPALEAIGKTFQITMKAEGKQP